MTFWCSPEMVASLEAGSKRHGSKDAALRVMVCDRPDLEWVAALRVTAPLLQSSNFPRAAPGSRLKKR